MSVCCFPHTFKNVTAVCTITLIEILRSCFLIYMSQEGHDQIFDFTAYLMIFKWNFKNKFPTYVSIIFVDTFLNMFRVLLSHCQFRDVFSKE
jgi:hypothetical protein